MITELDVNLLPPAGAPAPGQPPSPDSNPYANGLPDDVQQALARYYADAFRVLLAHRDDIMRVTFWGVSDGDSWLNRGRVNHPLLWDRQRQPKPAFDEVAKVLMAKRRHSSGGGPHADDCSGSCPAGDCCPWPRPRRKPAATSPALFVTSGGVVPGASVEITNVETNVSQNLRDEWLRLLRGAVAQSRATTKSRSR